MVTNPNYFSTSNDSDPLNQIKDAVAHFKNSNDVENPISQYDARKIYDEINVVISRINESIRY